MGRGDEHASRAASFGSVGGEYERGRPSYPTEAVAWLVGTDPLRVVDLGAGTGKLTRRLLALGHDVVAVEPAPGMLEQLEVELPAVTALAGTAEAIPVADGDADAVVAGQAFHWFDAERALPEVARVLCPGGRLGLVWNERDESEPWVRRLTEIVGGRRVEDDLETVIGRSGLFGKLEHASFRFEQSLDRNGLRDRVVSMSAVAVRPPAERARLLARIDQLYDESATADGLVLPYETSAYRTARLT